MSLHRKQATSSLISALKELIRQKGEVEEVAVRSYEWFLKRLNLPVHKAIVTYNSPVEWKESLRA